MLKGIVQPYGANAKGGGAQSAKHGGAREISSSVLRAMSLHDWRSNSRIAGAVVALLLGFTTAHWVAVAQSPVSKGSVDVKERVQTR